MPKERPCEPRWIAWAQYRLSVATLACGVAIPLTPGNQQAIPAALAGSLILVAGALRDKAKVHAHQCGHRAGVSDLAEQLRGAGLRVDVVRVDNRGVEKL